MTIFDRYTSSSSSKTANVGASKIMDWINTNTHDDWEVKMIDCQIMMEGGILINVFGRSEVRSLSHLCGNLNNSISLTINKMQTLSILCLMTF